MRERARNPSLCLTKMATSVPATAFFERLDESLCVWRRCGCETGQGRKETCAAASVSVRCKAASRPVLRQGRRAKKRGRAPFRGARPFEGGVFEVAVLELEARAELNLTLAEER